MMKLSLFTALFVATLALSPQAHAGKPPKHPQQKQVAPQPQQALAPDALPSAALQPFLDARLNIILAPLDAPGLKHPNAIADLRASIADAMLKAPPVKQPAFQSALAVCDTLSRAYDDRQAAVANLQSSSVVHSPSSLGVVSRSGYLSSEQLHSEARAKQNAAQTDAFFVNTQKSQWTQRATQWRQSVQQLYLREREIERQVSAPAVTPVPAASAPVTTPPAGVH